MTESVLPYTVPPEERAKIKVDKILLDLMDGDRISIDMAMRISHKEPREGLWELEVYQKLMPLVNDLAAQGKITAEKAAGLLNMNAHKAMMEAEMIVWVHKRVFDLQAQGLVSMNLAEKMCAMNAASGRRYVQAVLFVDETLRDLRARGVFSEEEAARYREMDPTLADTRLAVLVSKAERQADAADAAEAEKIKNALLVNASDSE